MNNRNRHLLERALDGSLTQDEQLEFNSLLSNDPTFKETFGNEQKLHQLALSSKSDSFAPYFDDRVMRRLRGSKTQPDAAPSFDLLLNRLFKPVAFASFCLILVLAYYNAGIGKTQLFEVTPTAVEQIFVLPPVEPESLININ